MRAIAKRWLQSPELSRHDDYSWASRCAYWIEDPPEGPRLRTTPRRHHAPLVITGHGARLYVNNGALIVRGGFTHYPQKPGEWRFFPGDPNLPSRIVSLDGSGSISFDALDWLAAQKLPLIRINWRGEVQAVLGGMGYSADPRKIGVQLEAKRNGRALAISTALIRDKIRNCIGTLKQCLPRSLARELALTKLRRDREGLLSKPPPSIRALLGIEGYAAIAYFGAWQSLPLHWKGTGRRPIPADWYHVGLRSSITREKVKNRNASHPVNAILNYAYAVLESQVHIRIVSEGYDPTISYLHKGNSERPALVFDLMEPLRPIVDQKVLEFVRSETFHPSDFTIRSDGVCRLNPELARHVVRLVTANELHASSMGAI